MSVAVVGAGNMGRAIARRLSVAGEKIVLTDAKADKAQAVAGEVTGSTSGSVEVAASVAEAAARGDVVVSPRGSRRPRRW